MCYGLCRSVLWLLFYVLKPFPHKDPHKSGFQSKIISFTRNYFKLDIPKQVSINLIINFVGL